MSRCSFFVLKRDSFFKTIWTFPPLTKQNGNGEKAQAVNALAAADPSQIFSIQEKSYIRGR